HPAGRTNQVAWRACQGLAKPDVGRAPVKQVLEGPATLLKRVAPKIDAGAKRHVEEKKHYVLRTSGLECALQKIKTRQALFVQHHHFTVVPTVWQTQLFHPRPQLDKSFCPVVAIAREKACVPPLDAAHEAI